MVVRHDSDGPDAVRVAVLVELGTPGFTENGIHVRRSDRSATRAGVLRGGVRRESRTAIRHRASGAVVNHSA